MRLSSGEIFMVLMIALLVFGAGRLPELGKGLGQGMRSFRDALRGLDEPNDPQAKQRPPSQPGAGHQDAQAHGKAPAAEGASRPPEARG